MRIQLLVLLSWRVTRKCRAAGVNLDLISQHRLREGVRFHLQKITGKPGKVQLGSRSLCSYSVAATS